MSRFDIGDKICITGRIKSITQSHYLLKMEGSGLEKHVPTKLFDRYGVWIDERDGDAEERIAERGHALIRKSSDTPQDETEYWRERLIEIREYCKKTNPEHCGECVFKRLGEYECTEFFGYEGCPENWKFVEIKVPSPLVSFQFGDKVRRKSDGRIGIVVHNVAQPELGSGYHHIYWEDAVSDDYLWRDEIEKVGDAE